MTNVMRKTMRNLEMNVLLARLTKQVMMMVLKKLTSLEERIYEGIGHK